MAGRVEIVAGVAGSGKTARLLTLFRAELARLREQATPGFAVWITPTNRSRRSILSLLLNESLRGCFAPNVLTFDSFAERMLRGEGLPALPLSPVAQRMIARAVIDDARSDGTLQYFLPIARTSGFLDLLLGFIAELKRDETWPEEFESACRKRGSPRKDVELAALYARYQSRLNDLALYDAEGRFWLARSALGEGQRGGFEKLSLVVVDGFADFTQPQYEILEHLAGDASHVIISLPLEGPLIRADLFAKSENAREEIIRRCKASVETLPTPEPSVAAEGPASSVANSLLKYSTTSEGEAPAEPQTAETWMKTAQQELRPPIFQQTAKRSPAQKSLFDSSPQVGSTPSLGSSDRKKVGSAKPSLDAAPADPQAAFRHIAAHLFDNPRIAPQLPQASGLEIIKAAGPAGEAREIAGRIKELLLNGVAVDQVLVAVRGIDDEGEVLAETLAAAGIPAWCESRTPVSRTPVAKAIFALLQSELDDWAFDRLCCVMRSNYFRPSWPSLAAPGAVDATIRILRQHKLGDDRERILRRLAVPSDEHDEDFRRARFVLRDFSHATERLRQPASFGDWVDRLVSLCHELGIGMESRRGSADDAEAFLDDRDAAHWRLLNDVLYEAAQTLEYLGDRREMSLAEFVDQLRDLLDSQSFVPDRREAGKVLLLEAAEVRHLDVDYLFFAGLSEASFPRGRQDDCLFTATERRMLLRKLHATVETSSPQQDEMLLFYSIVTRARRRLTLSYSGVSASGQPLLSSPYLAALRELFSPQALAVSLQPDLDPVPKTEWLLTLADLRIVATEEVRQRRPGLFVALSERPESGPATRSLLASARMAAARFEDNGFTSFEGRLSLDVIRSKLAEKFHRGFQFNTTQLESYATCPFRFLLFDVLKIRPNESHSVEISPLTRGEWLHGLLARLHEPHAESGEPRPLCDGAQLLPALRELIAEEIPLREDCSSFERALILAERHFAERFAVLYAQQWDAYQAAMAESWRQSPRPQFVELEFGDFTERRGRAAGEPARKPLAFARFGSEEAEVRVRGRMDRVDVGTLDTNPAFTIIDYKTRKATPFKQDDLRAGLALQLAIYVAAIRQSGILGKDAALYQMAYWSLTGSGCVPGFKPGRSNKLERLDPQAVDGLQAMLDALLPRMAAKMRSGDFPVYNLDEKCTGSCPYHTGCRVNQIRSNPPEREKTWGLALP